MLLNNNFTGIAHVGIPVYDIESAADWYCKNLRFKQINEASISDDGGTVFIKFLQLDNIVIELFQLYGEIREEMSQRGHGLIDSMNFYVKDISKFSNVGTEITDIDTDTLLPGEQRKISLLSANGEKVVFIENEHIEKEIEFGYLVQYSADLNRSIDFYNNLGIKNEFIDDKNNIAKLDYNGFSIVFKENKEIAEARQRGKIDHIAFGVKDYKKAFKEISSEAFIMLDKEPVFQPNVWKNGAYYFIIEGPDKEGIEFNYKD